MNPWLNRVVLAWKRWQIADRLAALIAFLIRGMGEDGRVSTSAILQESLIDVIDVIITNDTRYIGYVEREQGQIVHDSLPPDALEVYTFQTLDAAALFCRIPLDQARENQDTVIEARQRKTPGLPPPSGGWII